MKKIVFHFLQKVYYTKHWTSITKESKSDLRKNIDWIKLSTIEKPTFKWVASREKNTSDCPRDSQVEDYPDSCPKRTHSITILTSITKSSLSSLGLSLIQSAICCCMSGIFSWPIKVKTTVRERCFFPLVFHEHGKRKISREELNLRPSDFTLQRFITQLKRLSGEPRHYLYVSHSRKEKETFSLFPLPSSEFTKFRNPLSNIN